LILDLYKSFLKNNFNKLNIRLASGTTLTI
jgi:hypothetical protein